MDPNREYKSFELPDNVFNAPSGEVRNYNGQNYKVIDTGKGTRYLQSAGGSSSGGGGSYDDIVKRSIQMFQDANKPAVDSLEASIPEIANTYSTERTRLTGQQQPLTDRYNNLINEIRNNQTTATNRQTVTTNNELGRRGLLPSSGLAQQELTNALNPITSDYTGKIQDATYGREDALRSLQDSITGLTGQETNATRAVRNAIGQLQAGGNNSAITSALQQYQVQLQQERDRAAQEQAQRAYDLQQQQLAEQKAQNAFQQNLATQQYNQITLPQSQYDLGKPYYAPNQGGGSDAGYTDLASIFAGNNPRYSFTSSAGSGGVAGPPSYFKSY